MATKEEFFRLILPDFKQTKRHCQHLEKALKALLKDLDDEAARQVIEPMLSWRFIHTKQEFYPSLAIPLLWALGALEQMWDEWHRPEYRDNCREVVEYAHDILTGRRILVKDVYFQPLSKRPDLIALLKPEWYHQFVELMDSLLESKALDGPTMKLLITIVGQSDATSVAGHLADHTIEKVFGREWNPWDIRYTQEDQDYSIDCTVSKWNPDNIDWDTAEHTLCQVKVESEFHVKYICRGWQSVSWSLSE